MDERLYNKEIKCPVCKKNFEVTKVKSKVSKVVSRDSDFCIYYDGLNPLLYGVWVCEHCGYASLSDKFEEISESEAKKVFDTISKKWNRRSFIGERNTEIATDAFKLALLNLKVRNAKDIEISKVCLRLAWLYRFTRETEKEQEFLNYALNCYYDTYQREKFPIDKLDEATCVYMIAELYRRVGNLTESAKWFSRLLGSQEIRNNPNLMEKTREQLQIVKDEIAKKSKQDAQSNNQN